MKGMRKVAIVDYPEPGCESHDIFSFKEVDPWSYDNLGSRVVDLYGEIAKEVRSREVSIKHSVRVTVLVGVFEGRVFPGERPQVVEEIDKAKITKEHALPPELINKEIPNERIRGLIEEFDPHVFVDRSEEILYPNYTKKVLYSEKNGPSEIDVSKLEKWSLANVDRFYVTCKKVYDELKSASLIDKCFGLRELIAIQKRSHDFSQHHFGKILYGWRGAIETERGDIVIPRLYISSRESPLPIIYWEICQHVQNTGDDYCAYLI